jgi:hypothetical protein
MPNIFDVKTKEPGEQFSKSVRNWRPPTEDDEPLIPVNRSPSSGTEGDKKASNNHEGPIQTLSLSDPVESLEKIDCEQNQAENEIKLESVVSRQKSTLDQNRPGPIQIHRMHQAKYDKSSITQEKSSIRISSSLTLTKEEILAQQVKWENDINGIPQELLRTTQIWDLPIDFMCYLHFFSHSFGRGRRWCNMGIADLQKFCGSTETLAGKNTVRKALDRLCSKNLIVCIEQESPNQKTKKWLVRTPFEADFCCTRESYFPVNKPGPKKPKSKSESEKNHENSENGSSSSQSDSLQGLPSEDGISSSPPSTGTSFLSDILDNYFNSIRAPKALKEERMAYHELRERNKDVSDKEFQECFEMVSLDTDFKGNKIKLKFTWMAKGFDTILNRVRSEIIDKEKKVQQFLEEEQQKSRDLKARVDAEMAAVAKDKLDLTNSSYENPDAESSFQEWRTVLSQYQRDEYSAGRWIDGGLLQSVRLRLFWEKNVNIPEEEKELLKISETLEIWEKSLKLASSKDTELFTQDKITQIKIRRQEYLNNHPGLLRKYGDMETIEVEARQAMNQQFGPLST